MKVKRIFASGLLCLFLMGLVSCESESISENDNLYESIDKDEVEDPDDRGNG